MKIAVAFLCLSVASFIDTTKGNVGQMKPLDKKHIEYYSREMYGIAGKCQSLKTGHESEKHTRKLYILEDMMRLLKLLAHDTGCQLQEVLAILELPLELVTPLLDGNLEAALQVLDVLGLDLDTILQPLCGLLELLLGLLGALLKTTLASLDVVLGSLTSVTSTLPLHDTLKEVLGLLTNSGLLNVLNVPLKLLSNSLGGILGNIVGLGALLN